MSRPERFLFLRPDSYGDIVLFEPVFRILRQYSPDCDMFMLVRRGYLDIAPMISEKIHWMGVDINPYTENPLRYGSELGQLREDLDDIVPDIIVAPLFNKTWLEFAVASWYPEARKIGMGDVISDGINVDLPEGFTADLLGKYLQTDIMTIFTESVKVSATLTEWEKNISLASALCCQSVSSLKPRLELSGNADDQAEIFLAELGLKNRPWVACCPAGVANVTVKRWPAAKYGEVVAWLKNEKDLDVCLLGHSREKCILEAVKDQSVRHGYRPVMWMGNDGDIPLLCSLLGKSEMYFGNDTGAMHMACALSKPVTAICGGGHWPRFLPAAEISAVVTQELPCFYCSWKHCVFENAPCVRLVDLETVKRTIAMTLNNEFSENYIHRGNSDIYQKAEIFMRDHTIEKNDPLPVNIVLHGLPEITIVTPSFNQGQYLEECIDSVLSQNYPNLEYIIMDGGSSDSSVEIIKKYEKYLTYWQSRPDGGHYKAIDDGFKLSTGSIMAWLNSDDKYHKNALFVTAYIFLMNDDVEWIMGRPSNWDENGNLRDICSGTPLWSREMYLNRRYRDPTIQQESVFWRRQLWEKAGGYIDQKWELAGDLELWRRFFRYASLTTADALVGGFRNHPDQKTRKYLDRYFKEAEAIIEEEIALFGDGKFVDIQHDRQPLKIQSHEIEKFIRSVNTAGYEADPHYDTIYDPRLAAAREALIVRELSIMDKQDEIRVLEKLLKESEHDRKLRYEQIQELTERLKESDLDRQLRYDQIQELTNQLREFDQDSQLQFCLWWIRLYRKLLNWIGL